MENKNTAFTYFADAIKDAVFHLAANLIIELMKLAFHLTR